MFNMAERMYGKALTYNDMNLLIGFYDWLALPVPVIEVLLDYCVSNNKKNSRYLEKVALNWADSGITTVDEAEAYIKTFNGDYREILKALGHSRRDPNPKEIAFMRKWLREYSMPLELILEACGKTVIQTGGTSFTYVDKIISSWHEKDIRTLEKAQADEKEYRVSRKPAPVVHSVKPAVRQKSRFANYKGRDWDYAELERLAAEYVDKTAEG
jgi:DnaD/phage-associated family protein